MKKNNYTLPYAVIGGVILLMGLTYIYNMLPDINFSYQDDRWMLLLHDNVHPAHFSLKWLLKIFTSFNDNQYSPVNTLYFYGIYQINGYDPYYYHLFPFILHILNAIVIFFLSREILKQFSVIRADLTSYIICLLWAIHPLNVETVIWICGSKILICTLCGLLSFLVFIRSTQNNNQFHYFLSVILFSLACFTKEQAMVNPIMILLYMFCLKKQNDQLLLKWEKWQLWISIMLMISLAIGIISINANRVGGITPMAYYMPFQRTILTFYCLSFYLTNQVFPINLHYHYPFPVQPGSAMPFSFYMYPLFFVAFAIMLWEILKTNKYRYFYLMGIGTFFLQIILVMQILPMTRPAIMADRYMYFPSFALLLIMAPPVINETITKITDKRYKYLLLSLSGMYIIFFIVYSHQLAFRWLNYNLINL